MPELENDERLVVTDSLTREMFLLLLGQWKKGWPYMEPRSFYAEASDKAQSMFVDGVAIAIKEAL
jgi:hypothetical protein